MTNRRIQDLAGPAEIIQRRQEASMQPCRNALDQFQRTVRDGSFFDSDRANQIEQVGMLAELMSKVIDSAEESAFRLMEAAAKMEKMEQWAATLGRLTGPGRLPPTGGQGR